MFLSVSNVKSSSVNELRINAHTQQAMVEFNTGKRYLYSNVSFAALTQLILTEVESIGKWVNDNLKIDSVNCYSI